LYCIVLFSPVLHTLQERWEQQQPAVAASDGADAAGGTATWTGNSKDLAGSYTPFSSGIRACLGQVSMACHCPIQTLCYCCSEIDAEVSHLPYYA
jgi:hypothetical protein